MRFLSPTIHRSLTRKEDRELPMADSVSFVAVPQILTKVPEDFLWAAQVCRDRGYEEVNLNIGCPSGTVVAKGKGAGMLADPDGLDRFLEAVFRDAPVPISVKTRVVIHNDEEFPRLLDVLNRYPIRELTVHPRVRKDFYNTPIRDDAFRYAATHSVNPLCYNGDLCCREDIAAIEKNYPQIRCVMIGRGLIGDPGMLTPGGTTISALEAFHNDLLEQYTETFGSARNAMFRLKENWRHMACRFDGGEKLFKRLRKTTDLQDFRSVTAEIFHTLPLAKKLLPDWLH
jgi:tRNA-dihydrouridine synthase